MTASTTSDISINIRPATENDRELEWFDHTKLAAINTCPTWGIIRYGMGKTPSASSRAMALEAGSACHEVFAAVRLFDALTSGRITEDQFRHHGLRLFGADRLRTAIGEWDARSKEDTRTQQLGFCLSVLDTSGFYDDPRDKRRTMGNLEESCIAYIDRWRWGADPIWVAGPEADAAIGVEIPFEYVIEHNDPSIPLFRFTGKIDGIHDDGTHVRIHENKTASRLDDAWSQSFLMAHQVTGYVAVGSAFTGTDIQRAVVHGLAIPLPRTVDYGGILRENVTRTPDAFGHWARWMLHTVGVYYQYKDDPVTAPRYTTACNRYFRPCAMLPWCDTADADKLDELEAMRVEMWDPLESKAGD